MKFHTPLFTNGFRFSQDKAIQNIEEAIVRGREESIVQVLHLFTKFRGNEAQDMETIITRIVLAIAPKAQEIHF